MDQQERSYHRVLWLGLAVLAILTFGPTLRVAHVMWDNIAVDLEVRQGLSLLEIGKVHYDELGRLPAGIVYPLDAIPWFGEGVWFYQFCKISVLVVLLILLGWVIRLTTGSMWFATLAGGVVLVTFQNHINFDVVNSFPVSIPMGGICVFGSAVLISRWARKRRQGILIVAALLYFVALLTYEMWVFFVVVLPCFSQLVFRRSWGLAANMRHHWVPPFLWCLSVLLVFFGLYFLTELVTDGEYRGSQLKMGGDGFVMNSLKLFWDYTAAGLPLYHLLHLEAPLNSELFTNSFNGRAEFNGSLTQILTVSETGWWVRALVIGSLVAFALPRCREIIRRPASTVALFGLSLVVFPNLLLCVTEGHQDYWLNHSFVSHNTTFYCHLGWSILITLAATAIFRKASKLGRDLGRAFVVLVAVLAGVVSLLTDFWNAQTNRFEEQFSDKWEVMDSLLDEVVKTALPDGGIVYAPTLYNPRTYWENDLYQYHEYWTQLSETYGNENLRFIRTGEEFAEIAAQDSGVPLVYMHYLEESKVDRQCIVLAPLDSFEWFPGAPHFEAREMVIVNASGEREFQVTGQWGSDGAGEFTLPNGSQQQTEGSFRFAVKDQELLPGLSGVELSADKSFDPSSLVISYFEGDKSLGNSIEGVSEPVWDTSFYEEEEGVRWTWSDKPTSIRFYNGEGKPVVRKLRFQLQLQKPGSGVPEVSLNGSGIPLPEENKVDYSWTLRPGINRIEIKSNADSEEVEGRWQNFAVEDLSLSQ